jgi:beta-N-acetylhexosaminidase
MLRAGTAALIMVACVLAASPAQGGAASAVTQLSPDQLAGQRIVCGFSGRSVPAGIAARIGRGELAGVILFSRNVAGAAQVRRLTAALQAVDRPPGLRQPLLVSADQEGGEVRRLPGPPRPSAAEIGRRGAGYAQSQGQLAGRSMLGLGVNVDLAPVLDVARPKGFIAEQQRGYGRSAAAVSAAGVGFAKGLQSAGVTATGKHFPGLGSTAANTDLRPVKIGLSLAKLRSVDERPYSAFAAAAGRLVMISSARYPALDRRLPASQSPRIATDELRGRLGFTGVTITDALEVPSVTKLAGTAKTALRVARAGTDLLLYSDCGMAARAARALSSALSSGALPRAAFETSVERVLALRGSVGV